MSVYIPEHFAARERATIARLVHDFPFATLETPGATEPYVTHLPLLHVADCEPHGTLVGHFARANPHPQNVSSVESMAIFHGPHAYVTPSWYADPAGAVPTWNYAVAHVYGAIELARDAAETRAVLDVTGRWSGTISSGDNQYVNPPEPSREVGLKTNWWRAEDLYVIADSVNPKTNVVYVKVLVKPLVNLIWVAGFVFVLGSLVALWPDAREQRRLVTRLAPARA